MSQIKKYRLLILCTVGLLLLFGCSSANDNGVFDPEAGGHPSGWLPAGHKTAAVQDINSCAECHGEDLAGGLTGVSCSSCHMGGATSVHPAAWNGNAGLNHRDYVLLNSSATSSCSNANCHGTDFMGVAGSGPSCTSCHDQHYYDCTACHPNSPDVRGLPNDGKHVFHMSMDGFTCTTCHVVTSATHDNGTVDIASSIAYSFVTRACTPACHVTRTWPSP